jgi:hypothetical protein
MYPRMSLHNLLGDLVVYRKLEPVDGRLRGLCHIWAEAGLDVYHIPRKAEPAYARVVLHLLRQAQALRSGEPLRRLLYIGDTRMNDGRTIASLRLHLPVRGFIAAERSEEPERVEVSEGVMTANRWGALAGFVEFLKGEGFLLDEGTAAIVDLDKTAFGARGRNSHVIDAARVEAVRHTAEEVLGGDFDEGTFRPIYDELNQQAYHPFTGDNQDYLTYICLMASAGVYPFDRLLDDLAAGRSATFAEFIEICDRRLRTEEAHRLLPVHQEVYSHFRRGDPTPFKSFRYREYQATVARMDALPDEADPQEVLEHEIVLTREVMEMARLFKEQGVLLFGLTDKPDEASIPSPDLAARGYLPLHRVKMKVVGRTGLTPTSNTWE